MNRLQILGTVIGVGIAGLAAARWRPRSAWILLGGTVALILHVTWRTGGSVARADCIVPDDLDDRVLDVVQNLVLFLPVGTSIAALRRGRPLLIAGLGGLVLSSIIELVQLALPTRCASPIDVACNTVGAIVGAAVVVVVVRVSASSSRSSSPRLSSPRP